MFLEDILPKMSKLYLGRIVDSFLKDVHMESEEEMRADILKNIDEFQNKERVKKDLNFHDETSDISLLNEMEMMSLMEKEGYLLSETELYKEIEQSNNAILVESKSYDDLTRIIAEKTRRICCTVLEEAIRKEDLLKEYGIQFSDVLTTELELTQ